MDELTFSRLVSSEVNPYLSPPVEVRVIVASIQYRIDSTDHIFSWIAFLRLAFLASEEIKDSLVKLDINEIDF